MKTAQKSPERSTKRRSAPSLSQVWIGGTGLLGLVFDGFKFGGDRYDDLPSNDTFIFVMILSLAIGYFAWKSSSSSYRDVVIVVFAVTLFVEAFVESTGSNKVGVPDIVFDLVWICVGYTLYRGTRNSS